VLSTLQLVDVQGLLQGAGAARPTSGSGARPQSGAGARRSGSGSDGGGGGGESDDVGSSATDSAPRADMIKPRVAYQLLQCVSNADWGELVAAGRKLKPNAPKKQITLPDDTTLFRAMYTVSHTTVTHDTLLKTGTGAPVGLSMPPAVKERALVRMTVWAEENTERPPSRMKSPSKAH
jgi:hypothetical protein